MGLLDGFEELNENFENSIEYYLNLMVTKDQNPIIMSLDQYEDLINKHNNCHRDDYDYDNRPNVYLAVNFNKVHIIFGEDRKFDTNKLVKDFVIFLGTPENGIRRITFEEYITYYELFKKQWPDIDTLRMDPLNIYSCCSGASLRYTNLWQYDNDFNYTCDNYGYSLTQGTTPIEGLKINHKINIKTI